MTYHHHDGEDDDNVDDDFDGKDEWRHHSNDKKDDQEENYFGAEQTYTSSDQFPNCLSDSPIASLYYTFEKTVVGVAKVTVGHDDLPPTPYRCSNQIFQSAWAKLHLREFPLFLFKAWCYVERKPWGSSSGKVVACYSRFANTMYLLTEWEGQTGKYLARGHDVRTKRSEIRASWPRAKYFPVWSDLTRSISILSYDRVFLNFSDRANLHRSVRFFSRAVLVFPALAIREY